jgi:ankyrin repeat protein
MDAISRLKKRDKLLIDVAATMSEQKRRPPKPLTILVITAGDDMQEGADAIERHMASAKKESSVLRIDGDPQLTSEEQIRGLKRSIETLHEQGRIGPDTQVIINLHGHADRYSLVIGDRAGKVNLDAIELVDLMIGHGNPRMHFLSCESGQLREQIADREGTYFLHSGKKSLLTGLGNVQMEEFCHFLCSRKEPPDDQQIFGFLEQLAGENIAMAGNGKLTVHDTEDFEKHYQMQTGPDGIRHLTDLGKKKAGRVLLSKLEHGSDKKVKRLLSEFGNVLLEDQNNALSPLYIAARSDRYARRKLSRMLENGMDIDMKDRAQRTPLHIACINNHFKSAHRLIWAGADPNIPLPDGCTILVKAISDGNAEIINLLLQHGANPNGLDNLNTSCLEIAIERHDYETVELLLDHGAHASTRTSAGKSLLEVATSTSDLDLMVLLLDSGANPNERTRNGVSLLHQALEESDPEMVFLLLEHGADRRTTSNIHGSPLQHAISKNSLECLSLLLDYQADVTSVKVSSQDWHFAIFMVARQFADMSLLTEMIFAIFEGKPVASKLVVLCNELMPIAIENNAHAVVAEFISLGANDPKIQQRADQLALIEAAIQSRDLALLKTALKGGMPPDFQLSNGAVAFNWAIQQKETKMARMLLNAGAKSQSNFTDGVLTDAVDRRDLTTVKLLLRYRADPNTQSLSDAQAPSLLHLAVLEIAAGRLDAGVLNLFASAKADFREGARTSRNLVQIARDLDSPELARELIRLGASGRQDNVVQQPVSRPAVLKSSKARTNLRN